MPDGSRRRRNSSTGRTDDLFDIKCDPFSFERDARSSGYRCIAGFDEAGRGPLAGPVVAAAVVLPPDLVIAGLTDSKLVPEPERERLYNIICSQAVTYGIGIADERTIDEVNIYQASIIAMERALQCLSPQPDYLLLDAITLPRVRIPQNSIIKGDLRSHSIGAASILAKVTRDRLMCELDRKYPQYNFKKHKGYATEEHLMLLQQFGPCEVHRRSFAPVSELLRSAPHD